jgi:sugar lactone lactonase YvrE
VAFGDEPSRSSELPVGLLEDAFKSPGTEQIQLTDPHAAEELPHQDLGREEAVELTEAVFEPILQSAPGPFQDLEVDEYLSDTAAVTSVDGEGAILESSIPLLTEGADGGKQPVDLELETSGDHLEPKAPLVALELPNELGEGLVLPDSGIGIELVDAPADRRPSVIENSVATYPNIATNTDFSAVATPSGFETFITLRSADAPRAQTLRLDLPQGAELHQDQRGAEIVKDGVSILRVPPPFAIDANGQSVPVSLVVSHDSLTIDASPEEEAAYPVLVDPIFETYDWFGTQSTVGQSVWHPQRTQGSEMSAGAWSEGLSAFAQSGPHRVGDQAAELYWVPRLKEEEALGRQPSSYIVRMTLWHIGIQTWGSEGGPAPYLFAGIWGGEGHWAGLAPKEAVWSLPGNTPETWMNPGWQVSLENGEPGKRDKGAKIGFGIGIATDANVSIVHPRNGLLGSASVEVADDENPSTANGSIAPWVNQTATIPLTADAEDTGLGVKNISFDLPWKGPKPVVNSCLGTSSSPCPRSWTASLAANQYNPAEMPQGFAYVPIDAEDPVGNKAIHGAAKALVKVDHTAPSLGLSGTLTEQATIGTNAALYTLKYATADGDDEAASPLAQIGSAGTGEGKTQQPVGIATDGKGNVWVVDRENKRVEKFDESGKFLMQFGSPGSANGQFSDLRDIAITPSGNIWVSEVGNKRVQQFSSNGVFIRKIAYEQFVEPYGLAIGPEESLWVSDVATHRVMQFNQSGVFLREAHGAPAAARPAAPVGLARDANGNVWVVDNANNRLIKFDSNGNYVMQFGSAGSGKGQLNTPIGIAIAPSGNLLVTENLNNRVQVFQPTGSYLRQLGSGGTGSGQLFEPFGIALGANNTVFVADAANHRIARWAHADQDPQSGVVKVEIKVDGQLKSTPYNQACSPKNCLKNGEWTYNANEYATGSHKVDVISTDGVNLPTTKSVTIASVKDAAPPQLSATSAFFSAPDGWLEQKTYSYNATATDPGGYGVKSLVLKIDGQVVKSVTQSCPNGGCSATLGASSINMLAYAGGAHPAELIATDVANQAAAKKWTINVNPKGVVPVGETTDTLEAFEGTVEEMEPVAPTDEFLEPEIIAAGDNPSFKVNSGVLESIGTPASTSINVGTETVTIDGTRGAISVTPVGEGSPMNAEVEAGVAAVTPSIAPGVDTVVRPEYNGALFFTDIRLPTSPDSFTWHVSLQPGQTIKAVNDQAAEVMFEDGTSMGVIAAMPAHDATGAAVPTHLDVQGANITLVVSHKAGSYVYPVVAGHSFEVGYSSVIVIEPAIVEEELQEEGTPFRNPFPPSVGDSLTVGEMRRLMSAPRGAAPVPPPTASASKVREFELNEEKCHPDTCKAYKIHQWGPHFVRYTESVEWQYVKPTDPHREDLHCEGTIEYPFSLSTKINIANTGRLERWSAKKGSGKHLGTWCHFELDVWLAPHDLENFPGVPNGTASRSMQVWVYPNGYQNYHMFTWKGIPQPDEA